MARSARGRAVSFTQLCGDPKLFARVQTVYAARKSLGLTPAQKFLVERWTTRFVRAGANVSERDKVALRALNAEIAALQAQSDRLLVKAANDGAVVVAQRDELAGLSDDQIAAALCRAASNRANHSSSTSRTSRSQRRGTGAPQLRRIRARPAAMFSAQYHPSQDGFVWPTDAIEYPSQLNDHWADNDAFDWFMQHGGLTPANGKRFRDTVLAPGFTADPMTLYRAFRGGDPSVEGYERDQGLK